MPPDQPNPVANPSVVLREEFDDWAVLFNPDNAVAVGINPVGVAVWKLLDGAHSVDKIVAELECGFSDVPEAAPAEVRRFLDALTENGFVGSELEVST